MEQRSAGPYRSNAREGENATEVGSVGGDGDLAWIYGVVWIVCAVDVGAQVVSGAFGVRGTFSVAMLFLLPWLLRRTIRDALRRRD